jgi:hypothetical protein
MSTGPKLGNKDFSIAVCNGAGEMERIVGRPKFNYLTGVLPGFNSSSRQGFSPQ